MSDTGRLGRAIKAVALALAWPGRVANWAVLFIMIFTLAAVVASQLRMGMIWNWGYNLPVLGSRLTLAGLTELQWHAFAIMVMFGGAFAAVHDRHVRVDILYGRFSQRTRMIVNILGHLCLLIPFCLALIYFSYFYVERAFFTGERSDYGGLRDRWVIKSAIPIGLGVLLAVAVLQLINDLATLFGFLKRSALEIDEDETPSEEKRP